MVQLRTVCISAHLDLLCKRISKMCQSQFEFVYQDTDPGESRRRIGWRVDTDYQSQLDDDKSRKRAETCELLIEMLREIPLFERRAERGLKTVYASERWFKPINVLGYNHPFSGFIRLLSPGYFKMARRFVRLMENESFWVYPIGIVAARDFARLYGLFHGDLLCFFRAPKLEFERRVGGRIYSARKDGESRYGLKRMRLWSYFVALSEVAVDGVDPARAARLSAPPKKIMWCGRMLDWKRVDTLIMAWRCLRKRFDDVSLLIIGEGDMETQLRRLAGKFGVDSDKWVCGKISFSSYQRQEKVRALMREADVFVMPSDGGEGWGATVSDALMEGCPVVATFEAGSSATLLPKDHLFHAGNVKELADLLSSPVCASDFIDKQWSANVGATEILRLTC